MTSTRSCPRCSTFYPAHLPRCPECAPRGRGVLGVALAASALVLAIGGVAWFVMRTESEDSQSADPAPMALADQRELEGGSEGDPRPDSEPRSTADPDEARPPREVAIPAHPTRSAALELEVVDAAGVVLRPIVGLRVQGGGGILVPTSRLHGASGLSLPGADPLHPVVRDWLAGGEGWAILGAAELVSGPSASWAAAEELRDGAPLEVLVPEDEGFRRRFAGRLRWEDELLLLTGGGAFPDRFVYQEGGELVGLSLLDGEGRNRLVGEREVADAWAQRGPVLLATALEQRRRDPQSLVALVRDYARLEQWGPAVRTAFEVLRMAPGHRDELEELVVPCLRLLRAESRSPEQRRELSQVWEEALDVFRGNARVELGAGLDRLDRGELADALALLEVVRVRELGTEERQEWEEGYAAAAIRHVQDARDQADPAVAVDRAERALQFLPDDVRLLQGLGYALIESGQAERAIAPLARVASLDAGRAGELEPLLQRLEEASDPAHVAVIAFDMSEGGIFTQARFNGGPVARVLVDTGATFTAISEGLAASLGIDTAASPRRARVETAAGTVHDRPVVRLDLLDLGGAVQREVDAVVMPLEGRGQPEALIGMNFLGAYEVGIDAGLGRLWLSPTR